MEASKSTTDGLVNRGNPAATQPAHAPDGLEVIASAYLRNLGLPEMEFFALPPWLLLIAVSVGIGVSVLAGTYPAARAARVDPVQALRGE